MAPLVLPQLRKIQQTLEKQDVYEALQQMQKQANANDGRIAALEAAIAKLNGK